MLGYIANARVGAINSALGTARQNLNFSASCMILGSSALVIWPKVGVPKVVLTPEAPAARLGREIPARKLLVTLKASARNCSVYRSRIANSRWTDVSMLKNEGPGILSRPVALSVPRGGVW